jgi:hypothetical protein
MQRAKRLRDEEDAEEGVGGVEDEVGFVHVALKDENGDGGVAEFFEDGRDHQGRYRIGSVEMRMNRKATCQAKPRPRRIRRRNRGG